MSNSKLREFASGFRLWFYVVGVLNAIFGILASTTTLFGSINWLDTTTIIVFISANVALILLIFIVQAATKIVQENKALRELEHARGFLQLGKNTVMVSEFDNETKKLFYENKRAILLSSETLQEIFEVIKERDNGGNILKELGSRVGEAFAARFKKEYLKREYEKVDIELHQQIEEWCDFDSNAGFGKVVDKTKFDKEGYLSGELQLTWSVLTEDRKSSQVNLCDFMEGYFEGVLNYITNRPNRDISVKHVVCDLDNPGKPSIGCKFSVEQKNCDHLPQI